MSDRIRIAHIREHPLDFLEGANEDELAVLIAAVEAARRVTIALDSPHPNIAVIGCRAELDAALDRIDFN